MFFKGGTDGGGQGRSIGNYRASLHAYGGALYSVTCSQRKDHYTRSCFLADSLANGCLQRWCFSLCPWLLHLLYLGHSRRTRCPAPHKRNVSACPMQLYIKGCCQPAKAQCLHCAFADRHMLRRTMLSRPSAALNFCSLCMLPAYPGSPSCWGGWSGFARQFRSAWCGRHTSSRY